MNRGEQGGAIFAGLAYINLLGESGNTIKDIGIRFETNPYKPRYQIRDIPGYDKFIENKITSHPLLTGNFRKSYRKREKKELLC